MQQTERILTARLSFVSGKGEVPKKITEETKKEIRKGNS